MMESERLVFRVHAIQRMFEREISKEDVQKVLETGTIIESYPDDRDQDEIIVITVYEPDLDRWEPGFSERRR